MRYHVRHETRYTFEAPVFLEPHTIRLRPRDGSGQRVVRASINIRPAPSSMTEALDLHGNVVTHCWFDGMTDILTIANEFEVETTRTNPFDFLLLPAANHPLPWLAGPDVPPALLARGPAPAEEVTALAMGLAFAAPGVIAFLNALTVHLHGVVVVHHREFGDPHEPSHTLASGAGSCRDLAMLFVDACRAVGIASRFVSGYQEGDPDQTGRELHAWAEAFIPGGGWRGFDPSLGLAVADRHIPVASAPQPGDAAPVTGTFRGRASQTLSHDIQLTTLE